MMYCHQEGKEGRNGGAVYGSCWVAPVELCAGASRAPVCTLISPRFALGKEASSVAREGLTHGPGVFVGVKCSKRAGLAATSKCTGKCLSLLVFRF